MGRGEGVKFAALYGEGGRIMGEKKVLNEALDLLDGICAKVALDRQTHVNVQRASQLLRAEINEMGGEEGSDDGKE